jgi:hypothetical protein
MKDVLTPSREIDSKQTLPHRPIHAQELIEAWHREYNEEQPRKYPWTHTADARQLMMKSVSTIELGSNRQRHSIPARTSRKQQSDGDNSPNEIRFTDA